MEVRCSILERTVLGVAMLTMESADRELMLASVVVLAGTWSRIAYKKEVWLEVMLNLGPIHRMLQQPSLLRETGSTP